MKKSLALFMVLLLVLGSFGFVYSETEIETMAKPDKIELESPLVWDGQGSDSLNCDLVGEDGRTEDGWIHWIVTTGKTAENPTLVIGAQTFQPTKVAGNAIHFMTDFYELSRLNGNVYFHFDGDAGLNTQFVISDYCPGVDEEELEFDIIINKEVARGDTTDFNFTLQRVGTEGQRTFTLKHGQSKVYENVPTGRYILTEVDIPTGYVLDEIEVNDIPNAIDENKITFSVDGKSAEITFINEKTIPVDPEYKIEVIKQVNGGDAGVEFDFTINKVGQEKENFTLENQESEEIIIEEEDMKARFVVEEINMPEGYELKEIETNLDESLYLIDGSKITFFVGEEVSIEIKFINEKIDNSQDPEYNITVTKEVYSGSSLIDFNFVLNKLGEDNETFILRDGQDKVFEDVEEGTYILTEIMPSGYRLRGIETDVENVKDGNKITFEVDGESVEITYVNERIPTTPTDRDTTTRRDRDDDDDDDTPVVVVEEEIIVVEEEETVVVVVEEGSVIITSVPVLDTPTPMSTAKLPQTGQALPLTPFFGVLISAIGIYFKRQ